MFFGEVGAARLSLPVGKDTHIVLNCHFSLFQRLFLLNHPQDMTVLCSAPFIPLLLSLPFFGNGM